MTTHAASAPVAARPKPRLSFWEIWNMSFGFLGIQIGFAPPEREREPDLRDPGRQGRGHPHPLDRRAGHRPPRPAHRRLPQRPYLEPSRPAPAVLPGRRDPRLAGAGGDAELTVALGRRRHALDHGRLDQHLHGAVPRVRGRQPSLRAAGHRIRHAELPHRHRGGRGVDPSLAADHAVRGQQRGAAPHDPGFGATVLLLRCGGVSSWPWSGPSLDPRSIRPRSSRRSPRTGLARAGSASGGRSPEFAENGSRQIRLGVDPRGGGRAPQRLAGEPGRSTRS